MDKEQLHGYISGNTGKEENEVYKEGYYDRYKEIMAEYGLKQ